MSTTQDNQSENLTTYRLLTKSGLRVFPLSLGTMGFGEDWIEWSGCGASEEENRKIFNRYIEAGGNFIDTANFYQNGKSEEMVAKFIKENPNIERDDLIIATKYSLPMAKNVNRVGNNKKNLRISVDESLKRLQTDYIDILYVHFWDFTCNTFELMKWLDEIVKTGKVLHVAISDCPAWQVAKANTYAEAHGLTPFIMFQSKYSLVDRSAEQETLPMCHDLDVPLIPWACLGQGKLTGKKTREDQQGQDTQRKIGEMTEKEFQIQDTVLEIAKELNRTASEVALNWVVNRSGVGSALIGPRRLDQLENNLKALEFTLSEDQLRRLDEVSKDSPNLIFPYSFFTGSPTVKSDPSICRPLFFRHQYKLESSYR